MKGWSVRRKFFTKWMRMAVHYENVEENRAWMVLFWRPGVGQRLLWSNRKLKFTFSVHSFPWNIRSHKIRCALRVTKALCSFVTRHFRDGGWSTLSLVGNAIGKGLKTRHSFCVFTVYCAMYSNKGIYKLLLLMLFLVLVLLELIWPDCLLPVLFSEFGAGACWLCQSCQASQQCRQVWHTSCGGSQPVYVRVIISLEWGELFLAPVVPQKVVSRLHVASRC